ncbi:hypothetical protein Sste5346_001491 [Sporothrix stenoceras]|uniref:Acyltransferase 3 domain-containing protein n=1 Tax=Sporothrix stenoceras TaxID=5173 RepID=A0ABR3ZQ14_9PEZI
MANAALRGLRRWAHDQIQPIYDQLPTSDTNDNEKDVALEISDVGSSGGSSGEGSSRSSGSPRTSDHDHSTSFTRFGHERSGSNVSGVHRPRTRLGALAAAVMFLPLLVLRFVYLAWMLVTAPFRRIVGVFFPSASAGASLSPAHASPASSSWPETYERLEEFQALVPSFLKPVAANAPTKRLHPTAWLDGLRGVAAFFVVWHHASLLWFGWHLHSGYGSAEGERYIMQLPFLRLLISGPPHVAVFFVISGYALSYKPLRLSRQGRTNEASEAIGSSVFRRHTRLFLMPVFVSFVACMLTYLDLYGAKNWKGVALPSRRPPQASTFSGQLKHWLASVWQLTNPFGKELNRGGTFMYDQNLWTLPVEFDCSLVLFLCQAAFNRFRPRMRMLFMSIIAAFALWYIYWQVFLFLVGMLICDLHFELEGVGTPNKEETPSSATDDFDTVLIGPSAPRARNIARLKGLVKRIPHPSAAFFHRNRNLIGISLFIVSLYVLSIPDAGRGAAKTPGYRTLAAWAPRYHRSKGALDAWYMPLAATFLVLAIDRTPSLQKLFMHPFPQYLGYISFSMYVIHGTVIWTIGHWTVRKTVALTGSSTQLRYGLGIFMCAIVVWTIIVVLSDLVARTLDKKAVAVGQTLYAKCIQKEEPKEVLPTRRVE